MQFTLCVFLSCRHKQTISFFPNRSTCIWSQYTQYYVNCVSSIILIFYRHMFEQMACIYKHLLFNWIEYKKQKKQQRVIQNFILLINRFNLVGLQPFLTDLYLLLAMSTTDEAHQMNGAQRYHATLKLTVTWYLFAPKGRLPNVVEFTLIKLSGILLTLYSPSNTLLKIMTVNQLWVVDEQHGD